MCAAPVLDAKQLRSRVHAALRHWHTVGGTSANLLEELLLVQEQRTQHAPDEGPGPRRLAANTVLLAGLEELGADNALEASVLRHRFLEGHKGLTVAHLLNVSRDHVNRVQKSALEHLTEILMRREAEARTRRIEALEARLDPPQYSELFGVEQARQALLRAVLSPEPPWVIVIVGLGGIGKTALADSVARSALRTLDYTNVVWIRLTGGSPHATPGQTFEAILAMLSERLFPDQPAVGLPDERLRRVRQGLKAQPCLVVIDNLEAEAETDFLLEHLADLARPSKFLLTARTRPTGQARAFAHSLDELSLVDASALLRRHAADIGFSGLAEAPSDELEAVYQVTGGNPLALRLVASLAALEPLSQILNDLRRSQPGPIEALYRHIYWKVWHSLSADARKLLQAMPLVAETGGTPDHLAAISQLPEAQLWPAIRQLAQHSLLEVRGTLQVRRYGLHRLTETFLRTEIIDWPEANA